MCISLKYSKYPFIISFQCLLLHSALFGSIKLHCGKKPKQKTISLWIITNMALIFKHVEWNNKYQPWFIGKICFYTVMTLLFLPYHACLCCRNCRTLQHDEGSLFRMLFFFFFYLKEGLFFVDGMIAKMLRRYMTVPQANNVLWIVAVASLWMLASTN